LLFFVVVFTVLLHTLGSNSGLQLSFLLL
jgi:hypothetical protein